MRSSFVSNSPVIGLSHGLTIIRLQAMRSRMPAVQLRTCNATTGKFQKSSQRPSMLEYKIGGNEKQKTVVCRAGADPIDRALGSAPYLLPLLDGLNYGAYIFNSYPAFARILGPLFPLYELYASIPFASVLLFFALYLGVARNPRFTRFVRFNTMQAVLIDILLIIPAMFQQFFRISSEFRVPLYNVTWMYVFCCTAIGIGSCFAGRVARLPLVADASDAQIGR